MMQEDAIVRCRCSETYDNSAEARLFRDEAMCSTSGGVRGLRVQAKTPSTSTKNLTTWNQESGWSWESAKAYYHVKSLLYGLALYLHSPTVVCVCGWSWSLGFCASHVGEMTL